MVDTPRTITISMEVEVIMAEVATVETATTTGAMIMETIRVVTSEAYTMSATKSLKRRSQPQTSS